MTLLLLLWERSHSFVWLELTLISFHLNASLRALLSVFLRQSSMFHSVVYPSLVMIYWKSSCVFVYQRLLFWRYPYCQFYHYVHQNLAQRKSLWQGQEALHLRCLVDQLLSIVLLLPLHQVSEMINVYFNFNIWILLGYIFQFLLFRIQMQHCV